MRNRTILFAALLMTGNFAEGQQCKVDFLGTKTLYKAPASVETAAPAGYQAVFVNYLGRHGARHLTKPVGSTLAWKLLLKADSVNQLTLLGKQLKNKILLLEELEADQVASISGEGKAELQSAGARMQQQRPELFNRPTAIAIGITNKKRTRQSADAFMSGLSDTLNRTTYIDDINLRFYDLSPAYLRYEREGDWISILQKYKQEKQLAKIYMRLCNQIFGLSRSSAMTSAEQEKFGEDLFGFATILPALRQEIAASGRIPGDVDFTPFFSCPELEILGRVSDAEDFLRKGPGCQWDGVQTRIAAPLLADFIKTTDQFILERTYALQLRFAHAETLIPLATAMSISGADQQTCDMGQLPANWNAAAVAPLGGNLQWVLYENKGQNTFLVKVLLNEHEVSIDGLPASHFPYYDYKDLKAFYLGRLKKWGADQGTDMRTYLKMLK